CCCSRASSFRSPSSCLQRSCTTFLPSTSPCRRPELPCHWWLVCSGCSSSCNIGTASAVFWPQGPSRRANFLRLAGRRNVSLPGIDSPVRSEQSTALLKVEDLHPLLDRLAQPGIVLSVGVMPPPPLVPLRLRIPFRRLLPILLPAQRRHVQVAPHAAHRFIATIV